MSCQRARLFGEFDMAAEEREHNTLAPQLERGGDTGMAKLVQQHREHHRAQEQERAGHFAEPAAQRGGAHDIGDEKQNVWIDDNRRACERTDA